MLRRLNNQVLRLVCDIFSLNGSYIEVLRMIYGHTLGETRVQGCCVPRASRRGIRRGPGKTPLSPLTAGAASSTEEGLVRLHERSRKSLLLPAFARYIIPCDVGFPHRSRSKMLSVLRPQATALITGAASGVGFATAKLCREKGMHLALVDIDSANLQKAKDILTGLNASLKTEAYAIDVADQAAWTDLGKKVTETFGEVDLLMLNAGKSFKAEGQAEGGRIKTWTDVGYWKKVQYNAGVFLWTVESLYPNFSDPRCQRLRSSERTLCLFAPSDNLSEQVTKIYRPDRIQTRHHKPSRWREPRLQLLQGNREAYCRASRTRPSVRRVHISHIRSPSHPWLDMDRLYGERWTDRREGSPEARRSVVPKPGCGVPEQGA